MATIIDLCDAELPPAKRPPTVTRDGKETSHHLVLTIPAAVLRAGGGAKFVAKPATERVPAHFHSFTSGVNVHLREGLTPEQVTAGSTVRVEICATIVQRGDEVMDCNIYLNVFPATGEPEATVSVHSNLGGLPKGAERVYHGRSNGAVALRPPPEQVNYETSDEELAAYEEVLDDAAAEQFVANARASVDEAQRRLEVARQVVSEHPGARRLRERDGIMSRTPRIDPVVERARLAFVERIPRGTRGGNPGDDRGRG